jgi:hypothetical protein
MHNNAARGGFFEIGKSLLLLSAEHPEFDPVGNVFSRIYSNYYEEASI